MAQTRNIKKRAIFAFIRAISQRTTAQRCNVLRKRAHLCFSRFYTPKEARKWGQSYAW